SPLMMGPGGGGGGGGGFGGHRDGWNDDKLGGVYNHTVAVRLLPYLKPFKGWVVVAFIGMIAATFTSVAIPPLIGFTIGAAADAGSVRTLAILSSVFFAAAGVNAIGNYFQARYMAKIAHSMLVHIRTQMFEHLQTLSLGFYDRQQVGRLMSRVINDVEQIQAVMTGGIIGTASDFLMLVGIVAAMLWLDVTLALVTLSVVPILLVIAIFWQRRARNAFLQVRQAISVVNGSLQENVSGARAIQGMRREDENMRRFQQVNQEHLDANIRAARLAAGMFPAVEILVGVATAVVIAFGGWRVLQGSTDIEVLIAFGLWIQRFFDPIRNMTMQYTELQRAMASGVRIFDLLDTAPGVADAPDAPDLPPIKGAVTFDHVSFSYNADVPVIQDVDLRVEAGETIAIVGTTGAGKTTFVSLISRFYDPTDGRVMIDGFDLREIRRSSLARQMGMVLQEPFLFSGTVEDNIRFGNPRASTADIVAAAKAVGIHETILRMDDGYATQLQERGTNLSVGHRQLISLARAILADPRILILDEATASIDTQTEFMIQDALRLLLPGRTSFVIAHRLSTIREADRILVMESGRIAEQGTHAELLARGGLYARLYSMTYASTFEDDQDESPSTPSRVPAGDTLAEDMGTGRRD
ncbi:MAG: ABC transporter ATP-binding protein, partial [Chloroflexi bacterium]|nr:ABC transporter ATP-binding protein [Chloroflexota bacterium]